MIDINKYLAVVGYALPILAVWKFFAEGQVSRKSGKRLSYSFAIISGGSKSLVWFPGMRRRIGSKEAPNNAQMELLVFVWNSGADAITSADFFTEKGLRISVYDARIVATAIDFESHATVGAIGHIIRSNATHQGAEMAIGSVNTSSAEVNFSYLPPGHGAVFRLSLRDLKRKVPMVSVVGPIKGLRRTTFEGVIVSLPRNKMEKLKKRGRWIGFHVNGALIGMGAMAFGAIVSGALFTNISDIHYWLWMGAILCFELYYLLARDIRRQLIYRIPAKLAYWDPMRSDRD